MKNAAPLLLLALALGACASGGGGSVYGPEAATATQVGPAIVFDDIDSDDTAWADFGQWFTGGIWECDIYSVAWGGDGVAGFVQLLPGTTFASPTEVAVTAPTLTAQTSGTCCTWTQVRLAAGYYRLAVTLGTAESIDAVCSPAGGS